MLKIIKKKAGFYLGSKFRPAFIFYLIKKLNCFTGFYQRLIFYYDPNNIRRIKNFVVCEQVLSIKTQNYNLLVDVNDHVGFRTYLDGFFDNCTLEIAKKLNLDKSQIFLDIGANIGTTTVPVCTSMNCESIVVEASKSNGSLLLKNLFNNNIRTKPLICALVSPDIKQKNSYSRFYINKGNTGANSIRAGWNPSLGSTEVEYVPNETLDNLLSNTDIQKIGLIKIDVEGAEEMVLSGATRLLQESKAPIIFEYRPDLTVKYFNDDYSGLINLIKKTHTIYEFDQDLNLKKFDAKSPKENAIAIPKKCSDNLRKIFEI